jgi:hypothetical protein
VKEKKMANKKIWMGILVMALVFGMAVVGCNNDSTDDNDHNYSGGNYTGGDNSGGSYTGGGDTSGGSKPSTPQGVNLQTYTQTGNLGENNVWYRITWNAVTGAQSYNIYRATSSSGSYTKHNISPITSTTWSNFYWTYGESGMSDSYYFKVSAVNSYGESAQSNYVYITPSAIGQ